MKRQKLRACVIGSNLPRFVFFTSQTAAAIASQTLIHAEDNREFRVEPSPGPEEVNWAAVWLSYRQRNLR